MGFDPKWLLQLPGFVPGGINVPSTLWPFPFFNGNRNVIVSILSHADVGTDPLMTEQQKGSSLEHGEAIKRALGYLNWMMTWEQNKLGSCLNLYNGGDSYYCFSVHTSPSPELSGQPAPAGLPGSRPSGCPHFLGRTEPELPSLGLCLIPAVLAWPQPLSFFPAPLPHSLPGFPGTLLSKFLPSQTSSRFCSWGIQPEAVFTESTQYYVIPLGPSQLMTVHPSKSFSLHNQIYGDFLKWKWNYTIWTRHLALFT